MFIGHFALGLGAKRAAPTVSLGVLFAAAQLADLLWPTLLALGVEHVEIDPGNTVVTPLSFVSYPYSHSLLALSGWALVAAVVYARATLHAASPPLSSRPRVRDAAGRARWAPPLVIAALVLSHWVLDAISHRADMPLTLESTTRVGLGLWNSWPATIAVELVMFAAGLWLYLSRTRANDRAGSVGFLTLIGFLVVIYVANLAGPPPPSVTILMWSAQGLWLVVAWAAWADRHRSPKTVRD